MRKHTLYSLLIAATILGACDSFIKNDERADTKNDDRANRKPRQLRFYIEVSDIKMKTLLDREFNNLDSTTRTENLTLIHEKQKSIYDRFDTIKDELVATTGGYTHEGEIIGNRDYGNIHAYIVGKDSIGRIIYNELSQYYALFDTTYYSVEYMTWTTDKNNLYKKDKTENYKNFVELNLCDNTVEELLTTLNLFYQDVLMYEYMEIKRRQLEAAARKWLRLARDAEQNAHVMLGTSSMLAPGLKIT